MPDGTSCWLLQLRFTGRWGHTITWQLTTIRRRTMNLSALGLIAPCDRNQRRRSPEHESMRMIFNFLVIPCISSFGCEKDSPKMTNEVPSAVDVTWNTGCGSTAQWNSGSARFNGNVSITITLYNSCFNAKPSTCHHSSEAMQHCILYVPLFGFLRNTCMNSTGRCNTHAEALSAECNPMNISSREEMARPP